MRPVSVRLLKLLALVVHIVSESFFSFGRGLRGLSRIEKEMHIVTFNKQPNGKEKRKKNIKQQH